MDSPKSHLKVCQVCAVDFTLQHFLLPLIDAMKMEGWEVHSACSQGKHADKLRSEGYVIHSVNIVRSINPIAAIASIVRLAKLFQREKFDLVHVHTPVAGLIARVAARIARIPIVVYTAHGFYFHDQMPRWKQKIFIWLEVFMGFYTDFLFTQSVEDAKSAILEKIMPKERVLVIGNGVNNFRFSPDKLPSKKLIRILLNIPEKAFVVGLIGRQVKEKGICEFLRAALEVSNKNPTCYFLLIGERLSSDHADGVDKEILSAKRLLGRRLIITGARDDIPEMLKAMDIFCLPSWREGMPRTIIEAMMMEKPVIATNIRGCREEIIPGETGLLVPVASSKDISDAILFFYSNPDKCNSYGKAGRVRALTHYDEFKVVALQIDKIKSFL